MKTILITGCAGFIGFHLCKELLKSNNSSDNKLNFNIVGLDNINNYYDIKLKKSRIKELENYSKNKSKEWIFLKGNLEDKNLIEKIFQKYEPEIVYNLAAQAGVRYSLINPYSYINSNINGFLNILEGCRNFKVKNLIYASSSSVYGGNKKLPFSELDRVDNPVSLYAATKKANELMAHSYSHLYGIPSIGIRFFTVYGPWGRPDMAPMIFINNILSKKPIRIFNNGEMSRDFTYIDDVIRLLKALIYKPASKSFQNDDDLSKITLHQIFNIGNNKSVSLMRFISLIEKELGIEAVKVYEEMQDGDVKDTFAENSKIEAWTGLKPEINVEHGIKELVKWYKKYYELS